MDEKLTNAQRATVLIEALPYIQRYNNKIVVIKYGGSVMEDESLRRAELCRGVLEVSPSPREEHSDAIHELRNVLKAQLPEEYRVGVELDVILDSATPATVRQPDVFVRRSNAPKPLAAEHVVLVVEFLSPGSRHLDRVTKRAEYARAGIPQYWIVDLDKNTAEVLTLVDGRYEGPTVSGRIRSDVPVALDVDLAVLVY